MNVGFSNHDDDAAMSAINTTPLGKVLLACQRACIVKVSFITEPPTGQLTPNKDSCHGNKRRKRQRL